MTAITTVYRYICPNVYLRVRLRQIIETTAFKRQLKCATTTAMYMLCADDDVY